MPPGRKPNLDAKINRLIADLRNALVARETSRIEATVGSRVEALVAGLSKGSSGVGNAVAAPAATPAPTTLTPAKATKKKRRGWSAPPRRRRRRA